MKRWALVALVLFAGLASAADPTPAPAPRARAAELVRQLGDESFEVRRKSAEALLELGPAAEEAVRKGLEDADPEVRGRCKELLPQLVTARREARLKAFEADVAGKEKHDLPGWDSFGRLAGDDAAARALFARVFRADAELLELAQRDPRGASASLARRCADLRLKLVSPGSDEKGLAEVTALLLLAESPSVKLDPTATARLLDGLETLTERAALVKQVQDNPACRKLVLRFLRQERPAADTERALGIAGGLKLRDASGWARKLATDARSPGSTRGAALLLLGQVGDKTDLPALEPLLEDTTLVGTRALGKATLRAEVRDVALGATLQLNGLNPADFGFPYPSAVPGLKALPSATCLGFASDADRTAAFRKWKERSAKR